MTKSQKLYPPSSLLTTVLVPLPASLPHRPSAAARADPVASLFTTVLVPAGSQSQSSPRRYYFEYNNIIRTVAQ
jgi:hypothetical protein